MVQRSKKDKKKRTRCTRKKWTRKKWTGGTHVLFRAVFETFQRNDNQELGSANWDQCGIPGKDDDDVMFPNGKVKGQQEIKKPKVKDKMQRARSETSIRQTESPKRRTELTQGQIKTYRTTKDHVVNPKGNARCKSEDFYQPVIKNSK